MEVLTIILTFATQNKWNMKRKTVLKRLNSVKDKLAAFGVTQLGLFGSTVRGENTAKSDIDILLDFKEDKETYSNFMTVCGMLEEMFKRYKLDIVTKKGLSPYIGTSIINEVVYV